MRGVLTARGRELRRADGGGVDVAYRVIFIQQVMIRVLRQGLEDRPLIESTGALRDYAMMRQGFLAHEEVRAFYLDAGNHLIREELMNRGTVDESSIYVREMLARGLELGAAGLVLLHNHPSGDPVPSSTDREITRSLSQAGKFMGLRLLDHLIVARGRYYSFHEAGLL